MWKEKYTVKGSWIVEWSVQKRCIEMIWSYKLGPNCKINIWRKTKWAEKKEITKKIITEWSWPNPGEKRGKFKEQKSMHVIVYEHGRSGLVCRDRKISQNLLNDWCKVDLVGFSFLLPVI